MSTRYVYINGKRYQRYRQPPWLWQFAYAIDDSVAVVGRHRRPSWVMFKARFLPWTHAYQYRVAKYGSGWGRYPWT